MSSGNLLEICLAGFVDTLIDIVLHSSPSLEYLIAEIELVLPTFNSWTVHAILEYLFIF